MSESAQSVSTEALHCHALVSGTWHEFVFGVRWSADESVG
jgi:hypothetical protein